MNKSAIFVIITILIAMGVARAEWKVVDARWRPDANPWAKSQVWQGFLWDEGWRHNEQFYPKYFRPAGSAHVILKNSSAKAARLALLEVNGQPLSEVATTPTKAAPVIWYRVESPWQSGKMPSPGEPAAGDWTTVPGGGWAECTLRLRESPSKPLELVFSADGEKLKVSVPCNPPRTRFESISFSPDIDRIYVYVSALDGKPLKPGTLFLDGEETKAAWTAGPAPGSLILAEAQIKPAWEYGSHHLIEVALPSGQRMAQPIRVWDSYFSTALFGTVNAEKTKAAREHGINTYITGGMTPDLEAQNLNVIAVGQPGEGRPHTKSQGGVLFYYNHDEPDAHDFGKGEELPVMDRLGVCALDEVLPTIRYQRAKDPRTPNLVLVDNTYKPLHWYVYGQIADVFSTDPYVPLNGRNPDYVKHAVEVARDASAPRPLLPVLWACGLKANDGRKGDRPPSASEERIMAAYALGSGVKGLGYFIDLTKVTGEGKFTGLMDVKPLWEEVGRINRDALALAPYISIGCPTGPARVNGDAWVRTLLCGRDHMVLTVVNETHRIDFSKPSAPATRKMLSNVRVSVPLPPHFRKCRVSEVRNGKFLPAQATVNNGTLRMRIDKLDAARMFLISSQ